MDRLPGPRSRGCRREGELGCSSAPLDPALPEEGDSTGVLLGEPALASMALVRAFLSPRGTLGEEGKPDLGVGGCAAWRLYWPGAQKCPARPPVLWGLRSPQSLPGGLCE